MGTALAVGGKALPGPAAPTGDSQILTVAVDWPGIAKPNATVSAKQRNMNRPCPQKMCFAVIRLRRNDIVILP
jgi:hypothetical protein